MKYKYNIGDMVEAHYEHGNAGSYYTKNNPLLGVIDSIGTHSNVKGDDVYHVTGCEACWGEDELNFVGKCPTRDQINKKLIELGRRRDGVWQRQVTEILNMIDCYVIGDGYEI